MQLQMQSVFHLFATLSFSATSLFAHGISFTPTPSLQHYRSRIHSVKSNCFQLLSSYYRGTHLKLVIILLDVVNSYTHLQLLANLPVSYNNRGCIYSINLLLHLYYCYCCQQDCSNSTFQQLFYLKLASSTIFC